MGAGGGVETGEEPEEVRAGHGGATGAGFVRAATDVEEDGAAVAGDGRVRVVADLEEEFVGEVAEPHLLFFVPRGRIGQVDGDVAIVGRVRGVVDPAVAGGDLVPWPADPFGSVRGVAVERAEAEETGWGAAVFLAFGGDAVLAVGDGETAVAPCEPVAAEEDGDGFREGRLPRGGSGGAFEELDAAAVGVP